MKAVILAGGFGTRLSEHTNLIPKPMILLGGKPILWHIMQIYIKHGIKDFIIALGYKQEIVKDYFLNYSLLNSDLQVDLQTGINKPINQKSLDASVTLIDTGIKTGTAGRLKIVSEFIDDDNFFMTYGDGVCDINIQKLLEFHRSHGKKATVTAVRPPARFGVMNIRENQVKEFNEKPQLNDGWVNGGFFVLNKSIVDYIDSDICMFEQGPMTRLSSEGELMAYKHKTFWKCMDTKRDHTELEKIYTQGAPWL